MHNLPMSDPNEANSGPGGPPPRNPGSHLPWCQPLHCDAYAHRSGLHVVDGMPGTTFLLGLWQSTANPVPRVRMSVTDGPTVLLDLGQANLLGNILCDLVAQAGQR